MEVFTCEDSFEGMMTCVYEAWASRAGHSNVRLMLEPVEELELFCSYHHVERDSEKARKVVSSIRRKISEQAFRMVYGASLSCQREKLDAIYRFLILGFHVGAEAVDLLGNEWVNRVFQLDRKVKNEAHYFREFTRFSSVEGREIMWAKIQPKSEILTLLAPNFSDRMPSEAWIIVDEGRMTAAVHPPDEEFYLTKITGEELNAMERSCEVSDPYVGLWKSFFHAIGIEQRRNPKCQRTMMPLWYRRNMTEFREENSGGVRAKGNG